MDKDSYAYVLLDDQMPVGAFRPGSTCAALKVQPCEVVIILGVLVVVMMLRLVYLSKKVVRGCLEALLQAHGKPRRALNVPEPSLDV